ncbi:hypothetical protein Franean1_6267 [Parafrankia sp. EAN1pec]|uniref:hypothetical protein n=1 Tax=Parafrankia sp. (strain EAN1pec) TaxID=298653 RepID=UPI00005444D7|nr:hypothetical protein Franean1_6267 [Frankia sp. EAN1pec]
MTTWAEQRRADRAADREQARQDRAAAREQVRAAQAHTATLAAQARAEKEQRAAQRRADKAARKARRAAWRADRAVELWVYPLAVVSAVMAVPSMAIYGWHVYGGPTGLVLPLLSELGVWAFGAAVHVSRRRYPDRPVVTLQAGLIVFGAVAFGLNFAHGAERSIVTGLVMGIVSIAGPGAHQIAVASPPRSRAERARARVDRQAQRRLDQARRIAVRTAAVELDRDGNARLVHVPGLYQPTRRKLAPAVVAGLPVDPIDDGWDAALATLDPDAGIVEPALLTDRTADPAADPTTDGDQHERDGESASGSGGVGLLDRPESDAVESAEKASPPARRRRPIDPDARRKLTADEALGAARRLATRNGKPVTAEQLRTALHVSAKTARELRDQVNAEVFGGSA